MSYYLKSSDSTKDDFLGWKCYYGRTHYLTDKQKLEEGFQKSEWTGNLGYDWYKSPPSEIWTEDPTHGFLASYKDGCDNIGDLIEEEDGGGVVLKTMLIAGTDKQGDTQKMATLRLEDNNVYNKGGVFVMDVKQVPYACMVWPAFWLIGNKSGDWSKNIGKVKSTWPDYGEIDIIEQINGKTDNHTTLHTKDGCVTKGSINGTPLRYDNDGKAEGGGGDGAGGDMFNDCNRGNTETNKGGEIGCGLNMGPDTGGKEGGIYACEWVPNKEIKYWYWKHGDPQIPSDITKDSKQVDTSKWRAKKYTKHDLTDCDQDYFQNLHMIINTTVCGDWAGNTPPGGECTWEGGREGCERKMKQFIADLNCKDNTNSSGCNKPDLEELEPFQWKINYVNTYTTDGAPDGAPDEDDDNYLYWILGAIGVVFLVLILFIVVKKYKKTPSSDIK